ncbi:MAG: zinc ribbon domain-containing protein [Synergistaceae bacterium]|nr:zinc ribbon domain-containing protein [Synergistaceae bacterium]
MADYKRYCSECFLPVPPSWNQFYCPACGGRVKLRIVRKKQQTQAHPVERPREDSPEKRPKINSARKLTRRGTFDMFAAREKSVLGPRFLSMPPVVLFLSNILTAGIRSVFWMMYHMQSLVMMAKPEEKSIRGTLGIWLTTLTASFVTLGAAALDFAVSGFDIDSLPGSIPLRAAAALLAVSFLVSRHIILWCREVIIDNLRGNDLDAVRSRAAAFAPSALLTWFVGVPYIQLHINRMIRKKGLTGYTSSGKAHLRQPGGHKRAGRESPEPAGASKG